MNTNINNNNKNSSWYVGQCNMILSSLSNSNSLQNSAKVCSDGSSTSSETCNNLMNDGGEKFMFTSCKPHNVLSVATGFYGSYEF